MLIDQVKGERDAMEFRKRIESRYGESRQADAERKLLRLDGSKAGDQTVTYDKRGWVFWMLMQRMGREPTLRGMKEFIATYQGNPDHPVLYDFVTHMRRYAPDSVTYDDSNITRRRDVRAAPAPGGSPARRTGNSSKP